ncbi:MAG: M48 family peptidase [Alphaproteobacteria bacterium]|nr:M48 family peptidase [Alphaproteobacteria bacterium]
MQPPRTAGLVTGCATNANLGRDQLILVTDDHLKSLGDQTWTNIREKQKRADEPAKRAELEAVGKRIVDASGRTDENWEFEIFEGPPNAFVLPGGKVGFFSGLYPHMENEAQIANVLGHETGHVAARHAAERYSHAILASVAVSIAVVLITRGRGNALSTQAIAGVLGTGVTYGILNPYSREHELEADKLGLNYMAGAGYDPREAPKFWDNMAHDSRRREKPLEFLSTHPADEVRVAALQAEMPNAVRFYDQSPARRMVSAPAAAPATAPAPEPASVAVLSTAPMASPAPAPPVLRPPISAPPTMPAVLAPAAKAPAASAVAIKSSAPSLTSTVAPGAASGVDVTCRVQSLTLRVTAERCLDVGGVIAP